MISAAAKLPPKFLSLIYCLHISFLTFHSLVIMKIIQQEKLNNKQKEKIFKLWNNEYPKNLVYKSLEDFENYLQKLTEQNHYILLDTSEEIYGWATTFVREKEKWFAIIISENIHGKGWGTKMLNELKNNEPTLNGWVIDHFLDVKLNGQMYRSPLNFYIKNGFLTLPEIRLELETISAVKINWTK